LIRIAQRAELDLQSRDALALNVPVEADPLRRGRIQP